VAVRALLRFVHGDGPLPKSDEAWAGALLAQDAFRDVKRSRQVLDWLQKGLSKKKR
jgi:hypothetical protein